MCMHVFECVVLYNNKVSNDNCCRIYLLFANYPFSLTVLSSNLRAPCYAKWAYFVLLVVNTIYNSPLNANFVIW